MTGGFDPLPDRLRHLVVDADLAIEVDTPDGRHSTGRLTGHGHRLRLELDRPEVLTGTTDRSTVTAVVEELVRADLCAELHGPRGRIAVVDPTRTSRVAALVIGNPHVTIDRPGWALAARVAAPTAVAVAAAVTALLGAVAIVRRRRS